MRRYETFTILDPDLSEEGREPVIEKVTDLISQQEGMLVLKDEWGSRKLAYEIKKKSRGYYIRFDYCGTGPLVSEIERSCRIDDRVLKYMTVLTEDNVDIDFIKNEMAAAEAEKKAAEQAAKEKAIASESVSDATDSDATETVVSEEKAVAPEPAPDVAEAAPETKEPLIEQEEQSNE